MKRTCETCKHFCESFVEGQYRCFTAPSTAMARNKKRGEEASK